MSRSSGLRRYLAADSTQQDFSSLAPVLDNGIRADFIRDSTGYVSSASPAWRIEPHGNYRGVRLIFFGSDTPGFTCDYRLWNVFGIFPRETQETNPDVGAVRNFQLALWGTGTATLGTVAPGTVDVPAGSLVCDTLTWALSTDLTSPKGPNEVFSNAYQMGDADVFSPGDGSPAFLALPDFGSGSLGWLLEFATGGSMATVNALFEKTA